jgi:hypothetical protein
MGQRLARWLLSTTRGKARPYPCTAEALEHHLLAACVGPPVSMVSYAASIVLLHVPMNSAGTLHYFSLSSRPLRRTRFL